MDVNSISMIWSVILNLVELFCITLSIYLKHKTNALIRKCTSSCKGILNEICEKLREFNLKHQEVHHFE